MLTAYNGGVAVDETGNRFIEKHRRFMGWSESTADLRLLVAQGPLIMLIVHRGNAHVTRVHVAREHIMTIGSDEGHLSSPEFAEEPHRGGIVGAFLSKQRRRLVQRG